MSKRPICLAIQSGVVAGHVGLGAAVPVLARHGVEVWPLPTLLISNHAATPGAERAEYGASDVARLIDGLRASGALSRVTALLVGYLATPEVADLIADLVDELSGQAVVFVDPVLGDNGRLYLSEEVGVTLRTRILPRADYASPNVTEIAWLTGRNADTEEDLAAAARDLGPKTVFVTSVQDGDSIGILTVSAGAAHLATSLRRPTQPNGAGDAAAAWLLAELLKGAEPEDAAQSTVAFLDACLTRSEGRGDIDLSGDWENPG